MSFEEQANKELQACVDIGLVEAGSALHARVTEVMKMEAPDNTHMRVTDFVDMCINLAQAES